MIRHQMRKSAIPILPPRLDPNRLEAGCDEVGRGCIAGPVYAAAVILPVDDLIEGIYDSKQLSERERLHLDEEIRQKAISYAISAVSPEEIDQVNILQASFLAMRRAISLLTVTPDHLLIDGNRFRTPDQIPYTCVVKGDTRVGSIAAASILAKNARDAYMRDLAMQYPEYEWEKNVGYPTPHHLEALKTHGLTPHHRRSFAPCKPTLFDL